MFRLLSVTLLVALAGCTSALRNENTSGTVALENEAVKVQWQQENGGWKIQSIQAYTGQDWEPLRNVSGEYTLLYSAQKPDSIPDRSGLDSLAANFPEPIYKYVINTWEDNIRPVPMNTAGEAIHFFPESVRQTANGAWQFRQESEVASVQADWSLDEEYAHDIRVRLTIRAKKPGYFSVATPSLATVPENELRWGIVPGHLQGKEINPNLVLSYAYGQGIPDKPIILRERTASTLAPILSNADGFSLALIPDPGTARDPWASDKNTHSDWQLGLSLMNRKAQLSPTAYHPVLGQKDSYREAGDSVVFNFRYTLQKADWFTVFNHAVYNVYRFGDFLSLKKNRQSLTDRIQSMHRYVTDDQTSMWRVERFEGMPIGAQAYLGGVVGSDKDAMKNSDYGAMWMLATTTGDPVLRQTRLPYARNFKLKQQQQAPGFFKGAAVGQYYLSKSTKFTEEWGPYVEPIGLTYYTMLDIGNILLFEPNDPELRERLRLGAERLLDWQYPDGHWEVAYDREGEHPRFTELSDLRPTFYGLLVAYRILGDSRYLNAARKGADWLVKNAVDKANFLGVCGDLRFAPDFATGQTAQALLDLYDVTGEETYKQAAIEAAKVYTASIYTHPVATREKKQVNGTEREDWEISQVGLSFEHGGSIGSAAINGPILLASHAGMFMRMFGLTGETIFRDMARAAATGRDAFVDPATSVASYYWRTMNAGAGPYPHHAWWQIGWITDYLMAKAEARSGGRIVFPRGFITPKVGPHQTYGFAPGKIFGEPAGLWLPSGMAEVKNPHVEYIGARHTSGKRLYMVLLNTDAEAQTVSVKLHPDKVLPGKKLKWTKVSLLDQNGNPLPSPKADDSWSLTLPAYGLQVLAVEYTQ
jgi:hypothetical protein